MRAAALVLTVALAVLCMLWEAWLAPVRPGAWLLALKALPLLMLLPGMLGPRLRPWQWMSLLVLAYLCEGLVRATSESGPSANLAWAEVALSLTLFVLVLLECRRRLRAAAATPVSGPPG